MHSALCLPSLLVALAVLAASPATAQPYPDKPGDGIADLAGVLTPADAESVRATLNGLRAEPGVEVAVLTVRNLAAYRAASGEAFATGVYNHWKLGSGQRHDGVLVLLSVDDRFTRIELGDGVPADQDARTRAVVDGVMVPRFRQGEMSGGLRDGVLAVAAAFNAPPPAAAPAPVPAPLPAAAPAPRTQEPYAWPEQRTYDTFNNELKLSGRALLLILLGGALLVGVGMWIYLRTRKVICARCRGEMHRLSEEADDVYLDSGRRLEEVLGSVNYNVWHCAGCGNHAIARDPRLSSRNRCKKCGYRTVGTTRSVVRQPTYDTSGSEQVETKCAHCGWTDVDVIHLPRKQRPRPSTNQESVLETFLSGGGSSGDGGGGGGSSSGRGSSGRW